ncbi:MAG: RodZ domain-containing protein [Thermacetogeniaceae bacterium]
MGIGELLRSERESRGLTLNDVEDATKIRTSYIKALEAEKFDELPGEVYCLGFLKNYARFLGLDQQAIADQYKSTHASVVRDIVPATYSVPDSRVFTPNYHPLIEKIAKAGSIFKDRRLLLGGAAVIVCLLLIWAVTALAHRERPVVPAPPAQVQQQESTPANPPQQAALEIKLVGRQDCWTQVRVDGKDSFTGTIHGGETQTFTAQASVWVKLGNAGGVVVYENGAELPPLGNVGEVVTQEFTKNPGA